MQTERLLIQSPDRKNRAEIHPRCGGVLASLQLNGIDVVQFPLKNTISWQEGFPSSLLFPFPNRTDNGKFEYQKNTYQLPINEENRGHAIHGLVADKPFDVQIHTDNQLILKYILDGTENGYPFVCELEIDYVLTNEGLELGYSVVNRDTKTIPFGFGWHPYFRLDTNGIDSYTIEMPVYQEVIVNERHIPVGYLDEQPRQIRSLEGIDLDTAYLLKEGGWVETKLSNGASILTISQWIGSTDGLRFLVVYTPQTRDCIAIEPQTANINAFNNEEGLLFLSPNEQKTGKIKVGLTARA